MKPPFEYHARLMTFHPWQSCHPGGWYITDADGVVIFTQHEPTPLDLAREICAQLEDCQRAQECLRDQERAWNEVLRECDEARLELAVEKRKLRRHDLLREVEALLHKSCEEASRSIDIQWLALSRERNAFRNEQRAQTNKRKAGEWAQLVVLIAALCLANVGMYISKGDTAMACGLALAGIFGVYGCAWARESYLP